MLLKAMHFLYRMEEKARSEEGAGMAEYTLLLVLVAIALLTIFGDLATAIENALQGVINALGGGG